MIKIQNTMSVKPAIIILIILFQQISAYCQVTGPKQPESGPGGNNYEHNSVKTTFYGDDLSDQFWICEPAEPTPDSVYVVVYWHGLTHRTDRDDLFDDNFLYIKHLVRKGYTVVVPLYQINGTITPLHTRLRNAGITLSIAFIELQMGNHIPPRIDSAGRLIYGMIGYSLGGNMTYLVADNYKSLTIPSAKALCTFLPALGKKPYENLPPETKVLLVTGDHDVNVEKHCNRDIYKFVTIPTCNKNFIMVKSDDKGKPPLCADHSFHAVSRNPNNRLAINALDYYASWKYSVAILDCAFKNENCNYVFGESKQVTFMGNWSDGTPVRPCLIIHPDNN